MVRNSRTETYAGNVFVGRPLIDLLYTDLRSLPSLYLAAGSAKVLEDDATRLVKKARAVGIGAHPELAGRYAACVIFYGRECTREA